MTLGCRAFFFDFLAEFDKERQQNGKKSMKITDNGHRKCLVQDQVERKMILDS